MSKPNAVRAGLILGLLLASIAPAKLARADVVAYSNVSNFSSVAFASAGAANVSGTNITTLSADDINPIASAAGQSVTAFSFSVANFNTTAVSARALVRFYAGNGASGGPGTFLGGLNFNPISFGAGSVVVFTFAPGTAIFTLPTGTFWAGIAFDDMGTTGTTLAQLNNLGQGIFNPPTIGTSADVFFRTNAAGSFAVNNPAGGFFNFGGNPVANFGWAFTVVPEPTSVALLAAGSGVMFCGAFARRRRAGLAG